MIRLRLLGGIDLRDGSGSALQAVLVQPRRLALLAYLALAERDTPRRRDTILAAFWPELDEERARARLNKAVFFLRRALGPEAIVTRGAEDVAVDHSIVWCDVIGFREALRAADLGAAMALWRGDLLPGFHVDDAQPFEEWLERERATLRMEAGDAARKVARLREREGDLTGALSAARQAVELTVEDERALRDLIELLDRLGDRAGALSAYERFAAYLAREFDAAPAAETKELIARVRARDSVSVAHSPAVHDGDAMRRVPASPTTIPSPTATTSRPERQGTAWRPRWMRPAAIVSVAGVAVFASSRLTPRVPTVEPGVLVVAPFVGSPSGNALDSAGFEVADRMATALTLAGIPGVVPSTRVRELVSPNGLRAAGSRTNAARATGSGILVSGSIGGSEGRVELRAEVLRMPAGRAVVAVEPAVGATIHEAADSLRERLAVAVAAHRDWGDEYGWGTHHRLPRSLAAYRAGVAADEAPSAKVRAERWATALALDSAWPRAIIEVMGASQSTAPRLERLMSTFPEGDRDAARYRLAVLRQDWEEAYRAAKRRVAVDSVTWAMEGVISSHHTQRLEEAVRHGARRQLHSYWSEPARRRTLTYVWTAHALHNLGRFQQELAMATELATVAPTLEVNRLTMAIQAHAGLGHLSEVERLVASNVGLRNPEGVGAATASRATVAAWELRAHGHPDAARRVAESGVPWFQRRDSSGTLTMEELDGYLDILWQAERWEAAIEVAGRIVARVDRGEGHKAYAASALSIMGIAEARLGRSDGALQAARRIDALMRDPPQGDGELEFFKARLLFAVGDAVGGMDAFREAYLKGFWGARSAHIRHRLIREAAEYAPFRELTRARR